MNKRILSEIWIYPIKSLGGMRLSSSRVCEKGLQHDRRWMLVDENNMFMTQRVHPTMALFKIAAHKNEFMVSFGSDQIPLSVSALPSASIVPANIWNDPVSTCEVSLHHSQWFSDRLGLTCKLVFFPEENARPVDPTYAKLNEQVSLADGYPLLIIGQSSLDDLNRRLEIPVPMNRFRPNLVFTGGSANEEDGWQNFLIGKNRFAGVKPCARCALTTVNQDTGEKGIEPLATLSGYRRNEGKVYFGQNVLAIDHHEIHQGDEIRME